MKELLRIIHYLKCIIYIYYKIQLYIIIYINKKKIFFFRCKNIVYATI